jgi:hypothetical protein
MEPAAVGKLEVLRRSEEAVSCMEREWRASSTSPRDRWEDLGFQRRSPTKSGAEKITRFVKDGRHMSASSYDRKVSFGRRFDACGQDLLLASKDEEIKRLNTLVYKLKNDLKRAEHRMEVLEAQVKELSPKDE